MRRVFVVSEPTWVVTIQEGWGRGTTSAKGGIVQRFGETWASLAHALTLDFVT